MGRDRRIQAQRRMPGDRLDKIPCPAGGAPRGMKMGWAMFMIGQRRKIILPEDGFEIENVWPWVVGFRGFRRLPQPPATFFNPFGVLGLGKPPALQSGEEFAS